MKSLSSNLLKTSWYYVGENEPRVIDTNELVAKKIEEQRKLNARRSDDHYSDSSRENEFREGLDPSQVEALLSDDADEFSELEPEVIPERPAYTGPSEEELIAHAKEEIELLKQEAMEQFEEEKQKMLEEAKQIGYEDGLEKGTQDASEQLAKRRKMMDDREAAQQAEYKERLRNMESDLVETITDVYEHVFGVGLSEQAKIVTHLIDTTMHQADGAKDFLVHVSSQDYQQVSSEKENLLYGLSEQVSVEIVEDAALSGGDCIIETEGCIFDCGIDTQLTRLNKQIRLLSYNSKD